MKTAIISPHTDDALFSLGSFLASPHQWGEVTIISPLAGIPREDRGREKHTLLRQEHRGACVMANVAYINGNFLDDVYGPQDPEPIREWLVKQLQTFDKVIIPLGIHHPDHILIRNIFIDNDLKFDGFYEELPYRELYPALASQMVKQFTTGMRRKTQNHINEKEKPVKMYESQLKPPHNLFKLLFVTEAVWTLE